MAIYVAPRPIAAPIVKAGPIGPGAGVLQSEFPLSVVFGKTPQAKMRQAYKIGMEVPWVRKAESVIAARVSTVPFTLEDPEDETVDDEYPDGQAVVAFDLMATPQKNVTVGQPLTRSQLWRLTSRHVGLCGNAFWLNDAMNTFGIPDAMLYIRPDRVTANEDAVGNVESWQIDKTSTNPGTKVEREQMLHFMLEPPDEGHFGPGLVETWLLRSRITTQLDQQLSQVLNAGGRISGILSPKEGNLDPGTDQAKQMEIDWRTIVEQPDAANRLQIVYAPVEFQKTTLNAAELQLVEFMKLMRDDGLAFWGVPPSIAGVPSAAGLNSGDTRQYDEAALWQGPVHDRLVIFGELLQDNLLDRFEPLLGWAPQLIIDEPSFDDEAPRFDLLTKAVTVAMTDDERRELIGKPPLPNGLGNVVRLPMTTVEAFTVPPEPTINVTVAPPLVALTPSNAASVDVAGDIAGETSDNSQGKAKTDGLHSSLVALRTRLDASVTPRLVERLRTWLADQKMTIAQRIRDNEVHVRTNPRDTSVWFDKPAWDASLRTLLGTPLAGVATTIGAHVSSALGKAAFDPVEHVLTTGASRVGGINDTTRKAVADALAQSIAAGGSLDEAINSLAVLPEFDPYRAEVIARTETMFAYNASALSSYRQAGLTMVQAIDGDKDEECAARDGREFTIVEAYGIEDHPNGTLDWVPVLA